MKNGPWYNTTIWYQLSGHNFEYYFTSGHNFMYEFRYDVDEYDRINPSDPGDWGSEIGKPLTNTPSTYEI